MYAYLLVYIEALQDLGFSGCSGRVTGWLKDRRGLTLFFFFFNLPLKKICFK